MHAGILHLRYHCLVDLELLYGGDQALRAVRIVHGIPANEYACNPQHCLHQGNLRINLKYNEKN